MKAVVKSKYPVLTGKHCKACLDFVYAHKDWTIEDWKKVIWSDETKINHLGSDGHKWVWKKQSEGVMVEEAPTSFSPFSLADCTLLSHLSFNDFIAVAFLDLARDLDIQI